MKNIFGLIICIICLISCTSTKNSSQVSENINPRSLPTILEIETATRGFYNQIIIANGNAIVKKTRNGTEESYKLNQKQLQDLTKAYNDFELEKLNDYVSDSSMSSMDASTVSVIKITNSGDVYLSNDFDTANPPIQYKALVTCINQIINK